MKVRTIVEKDDPVGLAMMVGGACLVIGLLGGVLLDGVGVRNRLKYEMQKQEIMETFEAGSIKVGIFVSNDVYKEVREATLNMMEKNLAPGLAKTVAEADAYSEKTAIEEFGKAIDDAARLIVPSSDED